MFAPYVRRRPLEGSPAWPCPNAFLETRPGARGSHVRPASRGFAPAPPSRLSEDPMGMIRPGKGARSDRPVPRAQREWRQRGGGRGWRDNVRRRANRDPPQASTHRHILHHVRVTIYIITPAITDASARHDTSSSVSALPPPCPTTHPKGLSDSSRLLSDTIPIASTATTASTATAALDAPGRPHRDVTAT